jgi:hypothetical protein
MCYSRVQREIIFKYSVCELKRDESERKNLINQERLGGELKAKVRRNESGKKRGRSFMNCK